jgi:hypothetical protein
MTIDTFLTPPPSPLLQGQIPGGICDFVNLAVTTLDKSSSVGQKISIMTPEGKAAPLGDLFVRSIKSLALPSEIEAIEARYGKTLESLKREKTITPLDIISFATGLQDHNIDTLNLLEEGGRADDDTFEKLAYNFYINKLATRIHLTSLVKGIDLIKHKDVLSSNLKLYRDLIRISLDAKVMTEEQFYEILTKKIATGYISKGMTIPLPHFVNETTGEQGDNCGYFLVKEVVKYKGLMAFALVPQGAPESVKPTILFRPTTQDLSHENSLETFVDDLGEHIGERSFIPAKQQLLQLLDNPEFLKPGQKANVCGFSLGGAHAARLLAACPDKFSKAVFFNDPSTEEQVAMDFVKNLATSSHTQDNPLNVEIYHTEKDIVIHAGEYHVGYIDHSYEGAEIARQKCRVLVKKIKTLNTDSDSDHLPTPSLLSLAYRVHRAVFQRKMSHHTEIVFSPIEASVESPTELSPLRLSFDARPRVSSISSQDSRSTSTGSRSPRTPHSPSLKDVTILDMSYLNRNTDPDVRRFNEYRTGLKTARLVAIYFLQFINMVSKAFSAIKSVIVTSYKSWMDDSQKHKKEFIKQLEQAFGRVRADLVEFLSVPPPGNGHYRIQKAAGL